MATRCGNNSGEARVEKQGVHEYSPEEYGIDLDQLRAQFAFYYDRFVGTSATGKSS